jgi:hypothetical protein
MPADAIHLFFFVVQLPFLLLFLPFLIVRTLLTYHVTNSVMTLN